MRRFRLPRCLLRLSGAVLTWALTMALLPDAARAQRTDSLPAARRVIAGDSLMRLARWRDTLRVDLPPPYRLRPFVVPGSVQIVANGAVLDSAAYRLDARTGELWLTAAAPDVLIQLLAGYETYGYQIAARYGLPGVVRREAERDTSNVLRGFDDPPTAAPTEPTLRRTGAITRGVLAGSNRDVALESSLRVQLDGEIAPGVHVEAALTDANTPILADGTTQRLSEFDRVALSVTTRRTTARLGDVDLSFEGSDLARIGRKVQGAFVETRLGARGALSRRANRGRGRRARAGSSGCSRSCPSRACRGRTGCDGRLRRDVRAGDSRLRRRLPQRRAARPRPRRRLHDRVRDRRGHAHLAPPAARDRPPDRRVPVHAPISSPARSPSPARRGRPLGHRRRRPRLLARPHRRPRSRRGGLARGPRPHRRRRGGDPRERRRHRLPQRAPPACPPTTRSRRSSSTAATSARPEATPSTWPSTPRPRPSEAVYRVRFTRADRGRGATCAPRRRSRASPTPTPGRAAATTTPSACCRNRAARHSSACRRAYVRAADRSTCRSMSPRHASTRTASRPLDEADDDGLGAIVGGSRLRETALGRIGERSLGRGSFEATHRARAASFAPFDRTRQADFEQRWNVPARASPTRSMPSTQAAPRRRPRCAPRGCRRKRPGCELDGGRLALGSAFESLRGAARTSVEAGRLSIRYGAETARSTARSR